MSKKYHYGSDPQQQVDEWGDPIKTPPAGPQETVVDEWRDPVKTISAGPQETVVDEWGDPVKTISAGSQETVVDEWGDPVKKVRVNQTPHEYVKEKERLALERELVQEGLIYPRSHYLPRGRFRGILAVCLAFLFGIFLCLGALVGVSAWVGTTAKLSQLLGDSVSDWINPEYTDMSIVEFISTVAQDIAGGVDTLDDIAKYTPAVDKLIDLMEENVEALGIEFTDELKSQFKSTPFTGIGDFLMDDVLKTVELGKVMNVSPDSDPMMVGLCYGEEDEDYTVGPDNTFVHAEGGRAPTTIGMLMDDPTDIISTMRLGTLMGLNTNVTNDKLKTNAMMYALCYGKRGVDYEVDANNKIKVIKPASSDNAKLADEIPAEGEDGNEEYVHTFPTTVNDLMGHSNAVIDSLELGTMLGIDVDVTEEDIEKNGVMYSLAYGSRGEDWELDEKTGTIIIFDGGSPTTMKDFTSGSSELIEDMKMGDIMDIDTNSSKIMQAMKDWTIGDLSDQDKINSLKISDVIEVEDGSSGIIRAMQNWSLNDLNNQNRINRLKIGNIISGGDSKLMQAMNSWTIGDLSKQSKIDTLTLGDVMDITAEDGILAALADCPIGSMATRIDTLTLTEILGAEDISGNKLLKHLANSTVETLSSDMQALTVGEVFADEAFSFMEIKEDTENKNTSESAAATATTDSKKLITYQVMYENYFANHAKPEYNCSKKTESTRETEQYDTNSPLKASENPYIPHPYKLGENGNGTAIKASQVTTYRVATNNGTEELTLGYFTTVGEDGKANGKIDNDKVKTDPSIVKKNRENAEKKDNETWQTPYYCEKEIKLTPVYTYYIVDYDQSDTSKWEKIEVTTTADGKLTCTVDGKSYEVKEDDYGFYYEVTTENEADGESTEHIDLDRQITAYKIDKDTEDTKEYTYKDGKINLNEHETDAQPDEYEVRHKKALTTEDGTVTDAYDYILKRIPLYARYYKTGQNTYYEEKDTTEKYKYIPKKEDGSDEHQEAVELDRYVEGVWFMLLAEVTGEKLPTTDKEKTAAEDATTTAGKAGKITIHADKAILEMDSLISKMSTTMTDTMLWKLYFHGLLDGNPFYDFTGFTWLSENNSNGNGQGRGSITFTGANNEERTVTNLNDVEISEVVGLIKGLIDKVDEKLKPSDSNTGDAGIPAIG